MSSTVTKSILVKGNPQEVYAVWSDFETFPNFMENIKSITKKHGDTSHWVMHGPAGTTWDWEAKTTRQEPGKRIAWRSTDEGRMQTSGQVTFSEQGEGFTEVTVTLHYEPPAGWAGATAVKLFADPEGTLAEDLRNFKQYFEVQQKQVRNPV